MERIERYIDKAERFLNISEAEAALNQARKALEAICMEISKRENFDADGKPAGLDELVRNLTKKIKDGKFLMPKHHSILMSHVQRLGNHASHDQGEDNPISVDIAKACLTNLQEISGWVFTKYNYKSSKKSGKKKKTPLSKSEKEEEYFRRLSKEGTKTPNLLKDLFEELDKLQLKRKFGTSKIGSVIVNSPFDVRFVEENGTLIHERPFNFGVFYANGTFKNFSCQGVVGRDYLSELATIIPNSKFVRHTNEFRNCVVNLAGDYLRVEEVLSVKDAWLDLLREYLQRLKG